MYLMYIDFDCGVVDYFDCFDFVVDFDDNCTDSFVTIMSYPP